MAFQKTVSLENGLEIPDCYIRIDGMNGLRSGMTITMGYYKDRSYAKENNILYKKDYAVVFSEEENSTRWDKQTYDLLRNHPDFQGAIDVLEDGQVV